MNDNSKLTVEELNNEQQLMKNKMEKLTIFFVFLTVLVIFFVILGGITLGSQETPSIDSDGVTGPMPYFLQVFINIGGSLFLKVIFFGLLILIWGTYGIIYILYDSYNYKVNKIKENIENKEEIRLNKSRNKSEELIINIGIILFLILVVIYIAKIFIS